MTHTRLLMLLIAVVGLVPPAVAQNDDEILAAVSQRYDADSRIAQSIFEYAELGYLEARSSDLLQETLRGAEFDIEPGVAGIPTAFIASAGSGSPVIALLAEFDALPGISQTVAPYRELDFGKTAGHACGHHLLGTGSVSAAIVIKSWLDKNNHQGTIRLYGTPAEEGGSGKVYMVRGGLFDDVDAVLAWHPSDHNGVDTQPNLANRSARFRFTGRSAHAAAAPEKARSALDGVESFDFMMNLMREHVPQETRIHYVITSGGKAPNVVPDFAEVYYYIRHPDINTLREIWPRAEAAARGAAMGTETSLSIEIMHGNYSMLPNETLAALLLENLNRVGGVNYSKDENEFAGKIYTTLDKPKYPLHSQKDIQPSEDRLQMGSTDVGDISWTAPTAQLRTATWVPGTPAHSWQAIAAGGTEMGIKGLQVAAKVLALTAIDLFENESYLVSARAELDQKRGDNFVYTPLLGDRDPPLDYRLPVSQGGE